LETKVLEPEDTLKLMRAITPDRCQQDLQEQGGVDFGFEFGEAGRFRTAVFHQKGNVSITLRLIPSRLLTFDEIGLPAIVKSLCRRPRGMFLVTGPTGSGKTTTLATMIDYINQNFDRHIITIEDPIEYYHPHKKSIVNQREVGVDVPNFPEAVVRGLRQDPDVIMVGELRDLETIEAALRAAETGHLVFGTLHTNTAQGTVTRIVDQFPVNQQEQIRIQLASVLIACLCQALVSRTDGRGRIAAFEFMVVTAAIQNLIRENKTFRIPSSIQTGKRYHMQLLDEHLYRLYEDGKIADNTALDHCHDMGQMQQRIDAHKRGRPLADGLQNEPMPEKDQASPKPKGGRP